MDDSLSALNPFFLLPPTAHRASVAMLRRMLTNSVPSGHTRPALCANHGETSTPSAITVGRRRKSHRGTLLASFPAWFSLRGAAPMPPPAALPNPELTARPVRRRFSAQYKRAILDQVAAA